MRKALDALYLFAGFAAGGFLVLIFLLMMGLSLGREIGINIPAGDDFAVLVHGGDGLPRPRAHVQAGEMIRVGLLIERLKGRPKRIARDLVARRSRTAFIGYLRLAGGDGSTYDSWRFNDMSQGVVAVPLWIPQLGYCRRAGHPLHRDRRRVRAVVLQGRRPTLRKEPAATARGGRSSASRPASGV